MCICGFQSGEQFTRQLLLTLNFGVRISEIFGLSGFGIRILTLMASDFGLMTPGLVKVFSARCRWFKDDMGDWQPAPDLSVWHRKNLAMYPGGPSRSRAG